MKNLKILAQFEDYEDADNTWTFYECGKFTCTDWSHDEEESFWEIEVDNEGVKRLYYRHSGQHSWTTDYADTRGGEPSELDIHIMEHIELAVSVNEMIGDK